MSGEGENILTRVSRLHRGSRPLGGRCKWCPNRVFEGEEACVAHRLPVRRFGDLGVECFICRKYVEDTEDVIYQGQLVHPACHRAAIRAANADLRREAAVARLIIAHSDLALLRKRAEEGFHGYVEYSSVPDHCAACFDEAPRYFQDASGRVTGVCFACAQAFDEATEAHSWAEMRVKRTQEAKPETPPPTPKSPAPEGETGPKSRPKETSTVVPVPPVGEEKKKRTRRGKRGGKKVRERKEKAAKSQSLSSGNQRRSPGTKGQVQGAEKAPKSVTVTGNKAVGTPASTKKEKSGSVIVNGRGSVETRRSVCGVSGRCYLRLVSKRTILQTSQQLLRSPTVRILGEAFYLGLARFAPSWKRLCVWRREDGSFHVASWSPRSQFRGTARQVMDWIDARAGPNDVVGFDEDDAEEDLRWIDEVRSGSIVAPVPEVERSYEIDFTGAQVAGRVYKSAGDVPVGGKGDCWLSLIGDYPSCDVAALRLSDLRDHIYGMLRDVTPEEEWDTIDDDLRFNNFVKYSFTPEGELHVENYEAGCLSYAEALENDLHGVQCFECSEMTHPEDGSKCYPGVRTCPPDHVSLYDFLHMELDEYVGVDAGDVVERAMDVGAVELGKNKATEMFNADYESIPRTDVRLDSAEKRLVERYLGHRIVTTQRQRSNNDHKVLQIARDLARRDLDARYPHNTDWFSALHVGSTFTEVQRWLSHAGHDFSLYLGESKDMARVFEDCIRFIGTQVADKNLPALRSAKGNATRLRFKSLAEILDFVQTGQRRRIFLGNDSELLGKKYDVLMFEDSLYNMSLQAFGDLWRRTGAKVGYAIVFAPHAMVYKDAMPSEIYDYREFIPLVDDVEAFIDKVWPAVLAVTPFLPLPGIVATMHKFLKWCLTAGFDTFKDWVERMARDPFPLELFFGVTFDLLKIGPVVQHILKLIAPVIRDYLVHAEVVWKNGYSNGYTHSLYDWRAWVVSRRHQIGPEDFVDSEVVSRHGEMYVIRFWRSTGSDPVVSSIQVPENLRTVQVADIEAAWNPGRQALDDLSYFPVLEKDWFTLLNWCCAEPVESLSFAVVCTALNRIRGGLSLASNVLVEPMGIHSRDVTKVALAALMETYRRQEILSKIENNEDLKKDCTSNLEWLMQTLKVAGVTLATGGLAVPAFYLYAWLQRSRPDYEYVKYPEAPTVERIPASRARKRSPEQSGIPDVVTDYTVVLPHKPATETSCLICSLRESGKFTATGEVDDGQNFICRRRDADNRFEIGFDMTECTHLVNYIRDNRQAHTGAKVAEQIHKLENYFEKLGQVKKTVRVHSIRGGPGTGKTEVVKSLAAEMLRGGRNVSFMVPTSTLQNDYTKVKAVGQGDEVFDFKVNTPWYASQASNTQVLIVDEMTTIDWRLIRATAIFIGVEEIYLVGDRSQTGIRSEANEGIGPHDKLSGLDWERVPEHDLVKNYRLDPWRVKWLNETYGYSMQCADPDKPDLPPRFITKEDYLAQKDQLGIEREYVFSHTAATSVFDTVSAPKNRAGDGEVNMSVRVAQGTTIRGAAAVSCGENDRAAITGHGLLNVSVSRSRGPVYFVCHSLTDEVPAQLQKTLCVDTPEAIARISNMPVPVIAKPVKTHVLTGAEKALNSVLLVKQAQREIVEDVAPDEEEEFVDSLRPSPVYVKPPDLIEKARKSQKHHAVEFLRSVFHTCFTDLVLEQWPDDEEVFSVVTEYLNQAFQDDEIMGRSWKGGTLEALKSLWPTNAGKRYVDVQPLISALEELGKEFLFIDKNVCTYRSPSKGGVPLFLEGSSAHCKRHVPRTVKALIDRPPEVADVERDDLYVDFETTELHLDRYVVEYPWQPGKKGKPGRYNLQLAGVAPSEAACDYPSETEDAGQGSSFRRRFFGGPELHSGSGDNITVSSEVEAFSKPTFSRVKLPDMPHWALSLAQEAAPISGSFKTSLDTIEIRPHRGTPLRLGTDAYRLAHFLDPSRAWTKTNALNTVGILRGPTIPTNIKLNWGNTFMERTKKAGVLTKTRPPRAYYSQFVGFGNHYGTDVVDAVLSAQRLGSYSNKPKLGAETKAWARKVAENAYNNVFKPEILEDQQEFNAVVERALHDCKRRNYHGRTESDYQKKLGRITATFSNKAQFKPIKNGKLDLGKGSQGILQSPVVYNLRFCGWMRLRGQRFKRRLRHHFFTDNNEPIAEFRKRVTRAIQNLPPGAKVGIVDAKQFDSQQGPVTVEIERQLARLMGENNKNIEEYYAIRGNLDFLMHGFFSGRTRGEKGSGFPDTWLGNTLLQISLAEYIFEGEGPLVAAGKGDDYMRIQTNLRVNENHVAEIYTYLKIKLDVDIGDGGEYCGHTVSRAGMFPSITRMALKCTARRARCFRHFHEQQVSYRHDIRDLEDCGIEQVIEHSARAEGNTRNYVELALAYLLSMSRINEKQWLSVVKRRVPDKLHFPTATGWAVI